MTGRLTWLGHATVLLEVDGTRLLTDPLLRARVVHLRRHAPRAEPPGPVDAILISHLHHDHLDVASIRRLAGGAPLVVPRGAGRTRAIRSLGREVRELGVGEETTIGAVRIRAVAADHDGRRLSVGREIPAIGFVIEGSSVVYFAGDTAVYPGMVSAADHVDLALLPVWGWGTRLGPGHMDPEQAAEAAALVRPSVAVPVHWGTFFPAHARRRHHHLLRTPGRAFADAVARIAPGIDVRVLEPGGTTTFGTGG